MADWLVANPTPALIMIVAAFALCAYRLQQIARIMQAETAKPLADRIDALLPQTQCGHCGYPGCKPYARAIAEGDTINKCLPGGDPTVRNLAHLLERPVVALDAPQPPPLSYAFIREAECIGCTKCIQACPVDAILGAAKQMHTIIRDECTGCDLCVEPCPVDCIEMRPFAQPANPNLIATDGGYDASDEERSQKADHYRERFEAHQIRITNEQQERERKRQQRLATQQAAIATAAAADNDSAAPAAAADDKLAIIAAALARTQAKKAAQAAGDVADADSAQTTAPREEEDPQAKRRREIAAIDKRLLSTQEKLQQALTENAAERIAALQTALQTLREKREAAVQALSQGDDTHA
jgi:electron transport complex protein RnfB